MPGKESSGECVIAAGSGFIQLKRFRHRRVEPYKKIGLLLRPQDGGLSPRRLT
jgi:hypothetical protein